MKKIAVRKVATIRLTSAATPMYSIFCHIPNTGQ